MLYAEFEHVSKHGAQLEDTSAKLDVLGQNLSAMHKGNFSAYGQCPENFALWHITTKQRNSCKRTMENEYFFL